MKHPSFQPAQTSSQPPANPIRQHPTNIFPRTRPPHSKPLTHSLEIIKKKLKKTPLPTSHHLGNETPHVHLPSVNPFPPRKRPRARYTRSLAQVDSTRRWRRRRRASGLLCAHLGFSSRTSPGGYPIATAAALLFFSRIRGVPPPAEARSDVRAMRGTAPRGGRKSRSAKGNACDYHSCALVFPQK